MPVFLPGAFNGQRSLVGYNPWGHKESDMTEQSTDTQRRQHKRNGTSLDLEHWIRGWRVGEGHFDIERSVQKSTLDQMLSRCWVLPDSWRVGLGIQGGRKMRLGTLAVKETQYITEGNEDSVKLARWSLPGINFIFFFILNWSAVD